MEALDFFWDPVCPFAWITSRWVLEVAEQQDLEVRWQPISLRMINEGTYDDDPELAWKKQGHEMGLALLRVAAAVEAEHGNDAVGRYYTAVGTAIHVTGDREALAAAGPKALAQQVLPECGLPLDLAAATEDPSFDDAVREGSETSLRRTGGNVGTPVITFGPPEGPSFFGPVISRVPRGPEAVELWQAVDTLARHRWFAELKRSLREPPQTAS